MWKCPVCLCTCVCMWWILSGQNEGWQMEYMAEATKLYLNNSEVWNSLYLKEILKTIGPLAPFIRPHLHSYFNILGTPVYKVNCNLWAGLPLEMKGHAIYFSVCVCQRRVISIWWNVSFHSVTPSNRSNELPHQTVPHAVCQTHML